VGLWSECVFLSLYYCTLRPFIIFWFAWKPFFFSYCIIITPASSVPISTQIMSSRGAQYSSYKWISTNSVSGSGRQLIVNQEAANRVFGRLRGQDLNFISVFGRARQGKSFLMNCLSGELELFRVSNEKDSCTQGIDMSDKWIDLRDFSRIDDGLGTSGRGNIKVGFIDAEGIYPMKVYFDLLSMILKSIYCYLCRSRRPKRHLRRHTGVSNSASLQVCHLQLERRSPKGSHPRDPRYHDESR
jgi:hypothetical protein